MVSLRALPTRRVVWLAPNVTELLFAVGAEPRLVGIDCYSDQPAGRVERLPQVGTNYEPSLERIVALAPDVVFLSKSANRRETADALERMGVPTFITDTSGLADVDSTMRNIGLLTGRARKPRPRSAVSRPASPPFGPAPRAFLARASSWPCGPIPVRRRTGHLHR